MTDTTELKALIEEAAALWPGLMRTRGGGACASYDGWCCYEECHNHIEARVRDWWDEWNYARLERVVNGTHEVTIYADEVYAGCHGPTRVIATLRAFIAAFRATHRNPTTHPESNTAAKLASDPALAAQVKQHVEARNPVRETIPVVRIKRGLGLEESGVREIKIDGEHFPMAYVIVEATKPEADSVWKMADQEAEGRGNMRSMTLNLTDAESEAIENIAKSVEMTKTAVIRQGLRLYQLVHTKAKAGEKLAFTKDGKLVELIISGAGWPGMD